MSLKLGMYELFGRIIPGVFYLAAFAQIGALLHYYELDMQALSQLSLAATLALGMVAYILGTALNTLSFLWIQLFKPRDTLETALETFRKRNPHWDIKFHGKDWHVLLAYIRRQNLPLADDGIERQNAFSLMSRNLSLALIFLAINQLVYFFTTGNYICIALSVIFILVSLLLAREAKFFQTLFFSMIFETIMAYRINIDDLIEKPQKGAPKPEELP